MKNSTLAIAIFASFALTAGFANTASAHDSALTVSVPAPVVITAMPFVFSMPTTQTVIESFSNETGLPPVADLYQYVDGEGATDVWIDENGNRLDLTREGETIIVRREGRPTATVTRQEMSGILLPSAALLTSD